MTRLTDEQIETLTRDDFNRWWGSANWDYFKARQPTEAQEYIEAMKATVAAITPLVRADLIAEIMNDLDTLPVVPWNKAQFRGLLSAYVYISQISDPDTSDAGGK